MEYCQGQWYVSNIYISGKTPSFPASPYDSTSVVLILCAGPFITGHYETLVGGRNNSGELCG